MAAFFFHRKFARNHFMDCHFDSDSYWWYHVSSPFDDAVQETDLHSVVLCEHLWECHGKTLRYRIVSSNVSNIFHPTFSSVHKLLCPNLLIFVYRLIKVFISGSHIGAEQPGTWFVTYFTVAITETHYLLPNSAQIYSMVSTFNKKHWNVFSIDEFNDTLQLPLIMCC